MATQSPTVATPECMECGGVVDRVLPSPIPEGHECMLSEAMCGRALYCQRCYDGTPAIDDSEGGEVGAAQEPVHLGAKANAEDCPACEVEQVDLPYPWLCPAEPGARASR